VASDKTSAASEQAEPISASDAWYTDARKKDAFIIYQLVVKDFKLKYRRSALGVAWSVLNPLLMMVIMAVVFSNVMRGADSSIPNFPLYLIIGNTAFQMMSDSTQNGMLSIIDAAPLLKKVKINRYVFPVQKVLFSLVNYVFSMIAVILVMVFYRWTPSINALWFPVFLIYLTVFCIGLSLMLSAASVFFRDVIHLWSVVIMAWTYATPLFYSINILPGWMQYAERFNPMYLYVTFVRRIFLWRIPPGLMLNVGCAACSLIMLAIGVAVFRRNEHKFILYI
jgi:ABC-2 type transport system permease protein